jgi:hypothetical protein
MLTREDILKYKELDISKRIDIDKAFNLSFEGKNIQTLATNLKEAKQNLYGAIDRYGYANLKDSPNKVNDGNVVLNTIDVNFIAAGIKTNLISDNYVLSKKRLES